MPAQNRVDENAKDELWRATEAQVTRDKMKEVVHRQIEREQARKRNA